MSLVVNVLGSLSVLVDGRPVRVTAGRLRTLLVALALSADEAVSVDRLAGIIWGDASGVWGEAVPRHVRRTVQTYLTRLRVLLGPEAIVTLPEGYRLRVDPSGVDAIRFERLLDAAAVAGDPGVERAGLVQALSLWRGVPFDGVRSVWLEGVESTRLTERYLAAVERRIELDLEMGVDAQLVGELRDLTARYPLRERLWGQLMTALYRSGRQADALAAYQRLYRLLGEELGIEPDPAVQGLHRQILTAHAGAEDPGPGHAPPPPPSLSGVVVPRQLPADVAVFTGRVHELANVDQVPESSAVVITAIDGMAGAGKTALAVHIAHRMAGRYPDGQLFIDLHGFTQGVVPVEPAEALDHLLRSLGVAGTQIPSRVEERAALYRTRLAGRRMLIVLDNAATEAQVAPLLPGAAGCLVLVTSRRLLAGLDHTYTLSLDTLPVADAVALLRRAAGESRLRDSSPQLLVELVQLCGGLPLAIRIGAARLRSHPTWPVSHLVRRLRDRQQRLVELEAGQRSVTAALDLSYQDLSVGQQQTYRRLGLHPGPDFDGYAAAALLDVAVSRAGRLLEQLLEANLLQEPVPGRYRFHDLIRAHAAQTAGREESEGGQRAAVERLLDHYRHTAAAAMDVGYPYERGARPSVPAAATPGPDLAGPAAALGWLDTELANLLAVARYATEQGRPAHVMHLSSILHRHLRTRGRYHEAVVLHEQALTTARDTGHPAAEIDALVGLGHVHLRQGRYEQAADHLGQALQLARDTGNRSGELDALTGLGHIHRMRGRYQQATDHYQQALQTARATGNRSGEHHVLVGVGRIRVAQGRYAQAADDYQRALRLARVTGNHAGELDGLLGLGDTHRLQGRHEQAAGHYQQALQVARAIGYRIAEQAALTCLGTVNREQGRYGQASEHYQRLLDLAQESGDRNWQFEAHQGLGRLQLATGHPDAALTHHQQALTLATELGQPDDQARAHDGLAHAHQALKQEDQARKHWQIAFDILTELGIDYTDEGETNVATIHAHLVDQPA